MFLFCTRLDIDLALVLFAESQNKISPVLRRCDLTKPSDILAPGGYEIAPGGYEIAQADDFIHTRAS